MTVVRDEITCLFAGSPLDRADDRRADDRWLAERLADPASRFLVQKGDRTLMAVDPALAIAWQANGAVAPLIAAGAPTVFLGLIDGAAHFAVDVGADGGGPFDAAGKYIDARSIALQLGGVGSSGLDEAGLCAVIGQAKAILGWHARRAFCSVCGAPARSQRAGYLRVCTDADCGAQHFPRTDPVVIMLATHSDRCLVGRQPAFPPTMYSALAGFMEPGESIEEAVRRELKEEADLDAGTVTYVTSQPWPFPSSLMIGCWAEALSDHVRPDGVELEDARWLTRQEAAAALAGKADGFFLPPPMAIAHQIVGAWLERG